MFWVVSVGMLIMFSTTVTLSLVVMRIAMQVGNSLSALKRSRQIASSIEQLIHRNAVALGSVRDALNRMESRFSPSEAANMQHSLDGLVANNDALRKGVANLHTNLANHKGLPEDWSSDDPMLVDDQYVDEIDTHADIDHLMPQGDSLDEILDTMYETFFDMLPFTRLGFATIDYEHRQVVSKWNRSDRPVKLGAGFSAPIRGSSLQIVSERQRPRILNDLAGYLKRRPGSTSTELLVQEGFRSSLTFPVVSDEHVIGFLFFSSERRNAYRDEHAFRLRKYVVEFGRLVGELQPQMLVG